MQTPTPFDDESPRGYLLRLSEENGYQSVSVIHELLGEGAEYVLTVGWNYRKLQAILGPLCQLPVGFGYESKQKPVRSAVGLNGHPVHGRHLGLRKARLCVACMEEIGHQPIAWDLKAYIACPKHGRMMLKFCHECGKRILYNRAGLFECKCGADLRAAPTEVASAELVALMEILDSAVTGRDEGTPAAYAAGMPVKALRALDLEVLCKVIVGLATVCAWIEVGRLTPRSATEVAKHLPSAARLLADWPLRFHAFCGQWHRFVAKRAPKSRIFQTKFSWLFVSLHKNLKRRKEQTVFLVHAAICYALRRWNGMPIKVRGVGLRHLPLPPPRFGTCRDAVKVLGWKTYTVFRWATRGRIPAFSTGTKNKRPCWIFDMEVLKSQRFSSRQSVGAREVAKVLELPHTVTRTLLKRGAIGNTHLVEFDSAHSFEDVEEFRKSMFSRATLVSDTRSLHSLEKYLGAPVATPYKVQLIEDIVAGRRAVYLRGRQSTKNLYLDEDVLAGYLLIKKKNKKGIGLYEAIERFKLDFYEASAIFNLYAGRDKRRYRARAKIKIIEMTDFLRHNVPLRVIAHDAGIYSITLRQAIEREAPNILIRLGASTRLTKRGYIKSSFVKREGVKMAGRIARKLCSHTTT